MVFITLIFSVFCYLFFLFKERISKSTIDTLERNLSLISPFLFVYCALSFYFL